MTAETNWGQSGGACWMWRISYKGMTLEQVLIMAYMNALEAKSS